MITPTESVHMLTLQLVQEKVTDFNYISKTAEIKQLYLQQKHASNNIHNTTIH